MEDDSYHKLRVKLMDKFFVKPTLSNPHEKSTVDWHCLVQECKKISRVFKRRDGWISHHAHHKKALRNEEPYPNECEAKQFVREYARRRRLDLEAARSRAQATMPLPLALSTLVASTPLDTAPPPPAGPDVPTPLDSAPPPPGAPDAPTPLDTAPPPPAADVPTPLDTAPPPPAAPDAPTPLDTAPPPPAADAPTPLDTAPSPPAAPDAPTPLDTAPPPPEPAADRRRPPREASRGAEPEARGDWHSIQQLIETHQKNCRAIHRMTAENEQIVEELGNHLHKAYKRKRSTVDDSEASVDSPVELGEDPPADRAQDPPAERAEDPSAEQAEDPPAERAEDAAASDSLVIPGLVENYERYI